jgi:hypothetical protein
MTAALSLGSIAKALGGEVSGRQILAPGPGHSPRDRSLSVRVDPNAPDGVLVHSFAADDWRACRDHVKARLGIEPERERKGGEFPALGRCSPKSCRPIGTRNSVADGRSISGTIAAIHAERRSSSI